AQRQAAICRETRGHCRLHRAPVRRHQPWEEGPVQKMVVRAKAQTEAGRGRQWLAIKQLLRSAVQYEVCSTQHVRGPSSTARNSKCTRLTTFRPRWMKESRSIFIEYRPVRGAICLHASDRTERHTVRLCRSISITCSRRGDARLKSSRSCWASAYVSWGTPRFCPPACSTILVRSGTFFARTKQSSWSSSRSACRTFPISGSRSNRTFNPRRLMLQGW